MLNSYFTPNVKEFNTKRNEGKDKILAAMDAAVSTRIVKRICHGATVAKRQKIFRILVWLSSCAKCSQVYAFLELGWDFQVL